MKRFKYLLACGASIVVMSTAQTASAQQRNFDVPSQSAVRSIPEFAKQAGLQIIAPAGQLNGVTTPAIKGQRDARAALRELLAGTGLVIASDDGSVIALRRADPGPQRPAERSAGAEAALDNTVGEVLVTGSRLAARNAETPAPVAVISADAVVGRSGRIALGDELSVLPQFKSTMTQAASGTGEITGQVGLNLLDLRGLGTSRTLVLQNGRRLVSSSQYVSQPDVNMIPAALLERVEILTGGASAVYGADATAGVVNFVLKDDFSGFEVSAYGGLSDRRDAGSASFTATAGKNFDEDRGNVAGSLTYATRDQVGFRDRRFAAIQTSLAPNATGGPPTYVLVEDLRLIAASNGGTVIAGAGPGGLNILRFAPDGTLNPANYGAGSLYPTAPISRGGDGFNAVGTGTLLPDNERLSFNLLGHYDVNDHLTLFAQGAAVQQTASAYSQSYAASVPFTSNNPYLTAQARAALPAGQTNFAMTRANDDLGIGGESVERRMLQFVVGGKGQISDNWRYDLSYSYGRNEVTSTFLNRVNVKRFGLAANAVLDTAGVLGTPGAIVCASRLATGGRPSGDADVDGCVPANFFGNGQVSAAARDYMSLQTQAKGVLDQSVIGGFVTGDTSGVFSLPAGPIALVAGFEHRTEHTKFDPDPMDAAGRTNAGGFVALPRKTIKVTEGYAEVKAPLIADMPFVRQLDLSGSVRISDYNLAGVGRKSSYGLGLLYAPIDDLKLKASYQRAVRAPNVNELFQPTAQTFFSVFDPCSDANLNAGSATRRANCIALGKPTPFNASTIGGTISGVNAGNPNLDVETAKTWTLGVLYTPHYLPGFSASLDYYNIEIDDAITTLRPTILLNQCVDGPTLNANICGLITRNPGTFDVTSIRRSPVNVARLEAQGIDLDTQYRFDLPADGLGNIRALATYILERSDYLSPSQPNLATKLVEGVGTPRFQLNVAADATYGPVSVGYKLRFFTSVYRADLSGAQMRDDNLAPPGFQKTGKATYHDVRVNYEFNDNGSVYFGIDNLFDKEPPLGMSGSSTNGGAIYDNIGRFYYTGVRYSF